ncbi:MAG: hypothetical protein ABFD07_08585 [Methanobacterium sp.]
MSKYRTAQGKVIDMTQLMARNEKVRAVGNMPVNARGDTIDSNGKVIVPVNKKVNANYQRAVATKAPEKAKEASVANNTASTIEVDPVVETNDLTEEEIQFLESLDEDDADDAGFEIKPASEAPEFFAPEQTIKSKKSK